MRILLRYDKYNVGAQPFSLFRACGRVDSCFNLATAAFSKK